MKKVFLLLSIAALVISSCNTTKLVTNSIDKFLKDHNYQQTATYNEVTKATTITASIEGLYDTEKLKEICQQTDITFQIIKGKVVIVATCPGAEQKIKDIIGQLVANIQFGK